MFEYFSKFIYFLYFKALKRLHQLDILGFHLKVEYGNNECDLVANSVQCRNVLDRKSNIVVRKDKISAGNDSTLRQVEADNDVSEAISSKLGVHHSFPKHLSYLYPSPTIAILTNIANAMAAIPRFYTQVLHLMNKMNLSPPFTVQTITPPLPGDTIQLIDACVDTNDLEDYESSEGSEIESDSQDTNDGNQLNTSSTYVLETGIKRKRLKPMKFSSYNQSKKNKTLQQQDIDEAFEKSQQVRMKRIEFKLANNIASAFTEHKAERIMTSNEEENLSCGFGVLEQSEADDKNDADYDDSSKNGVYISSKEIELQRMSRDDLNAIPQMKNYQKGTPTDRIYIKNLSKQTTIEDLEYIFKRFITKCEDSEKQKFDIRLMKEGRMKGQAFVNFPSKLEASCALEELHGFILHEKPLLIKEAPQRDLIIYSVRLCDEDLHNLCKAHARPCDQELHE
eukprot:gene5483-6168_t